MKIKNYDPNEGRTEGGFSRYQGINIGDIHYITDTYDYCSQESINARDKQLQQAPNTPEDLLMRFPTQIYKIASYNEKTKTATVEVVKDKGLIKKVVEAMEKSTQDNSEKLLIDSELDPESEE